MASSPVAPPTEPSAVRRNEFNLVLPGFDYDEQLRLDFSHPGLLSSWTAPTYTSSTKKKNWPGSCDTRQAREAATLCLRYGNNITILFRACKALSRFYGSPAFWPAVSIGFRTGSCATEDMVNDLVRARLTYRRSTNRYFQSGATSAADTWIKFVDQASGSGPWRPSASRLDSLVEAADRDASSFYEESRRRFMLDDAACMLSKRGIEELQYCLRASQRASRKRPPSPTPLESPREAKRVSSSDWSSERPAATIGQQPPPTKANLPPKPPLALDTKRPEQQAKRKAKQEYPTPTSVIERTQPEEYASLPQAPPVENIGARIRGIAQQGSHSPPADNSQPVLESQSTLQVQVKKQGATDAQQESSVPIKDAPGTSKATSNRSTTSPEPGLVTMMQGKIAILEKQLLQVKVEREKEASNAQALMQDKIASLEKQLLEIKAGREKDAASDKALIVAFETRMVELEHSRSAAAVLMQKMQAELALMQSKSVPPDSSQVPAASVDNTLETYQKEMLKLDERLTALEEEGITVRRAIRGMDQTNRNGLSPTPPEDILRSVDDMQKRVKALPTMHHVADKAFQLEKKLRESLQTYQRINEEGMDQMSLDLDNMRAQIRGLVKQFDKATACLPKTAILQATQEEVARLKTEVRTKTDALQKKGDTHTTDLASLSGRVGDLSSKTDSLAQKAADTHLQQALDSLQASVASLSGRGEELSSKTDALVQEVAQTQLQASDSLQSVTSLSGRVDTLASKTDALEQKVEATQAQGSASTLSGRGEEMGSKIDALVQEMEDRRAESDVLRGTLSQLLSQLHRTRPGTTAPGTDQASPAASHLSNGTPNVPQTGPPSNSTVRVSAPAGFQIRPGGPRGL